MRIYFRVIKNERNLNLETENKLALIISVVIIVAFMLSSLYT